MNRRKYEKFIMDCDPGHYDAIELILAAKYLDFLGITTVVACPQFFVAGNFALKRWF